MTRDPTNKKNLAIESTAASFTSSVFLKLFHKKSKKKGSSSTAKSMKETRDRQVVQHSKFDSSRDYYRKNESPNSRQSKNDKKMTTMNKEEKKTKPTFDLELLLEPYQDTNENENFLSFLKESEKYVCADHNLVSIIDCSNF